MKLTDYRIQVEALNAEGETLHDYVQYREGDKLIFSVVVDAGKTTECLIFFDPKAPNPQNLVFVYAKNGKLLVTVGEAAEAKVIAKDASGKELGNVEASSVNKAFYGNAGEVFSDSHNFRPTQGFAGPLLDNLFMSQALEEAHCQICPAAKSRSNLAGLLGASAQRPATTIALGNVTKWNEELILAKHLEEVVAKGRG